MNAIRTLDAIYNQLNGIDAEDLTQAESNILNLLLCCSEWQPLHQMKAGDAIAREAYIAQRQRDNSARILGEDS